MQHPAGRLTVCGLRSAVHGQRLTACADSWGDASAAGIVSCAPEVRRADFRYGGRWPFRWPPQAHSDGDPDREPERPIARGNPDGNPDPGPNRHPEAHAESEGPALLLLVRLNHLRPFVAGADIVVRRIWMSRRRGWAAGGGVPELLGLTDAVAGGRCVAHVRVGMRADKAPLLAGP